MNKTSQIFSVTAPYANKYQGAHPRVLFVCLAGMLRSPTAAEIGVKDFGFNTRSCGSSDKALIPLSANLIEWATTIVSLDAEAFELALNTFRNTGYDEDLLNKIIHCDLFDDYDFRQQSLVNSVKNFLTNNEKVIRLHAENLKDPYEYDTNDP